METKKSKKVDLKSKQFLFLQIGLVTALGIVFSAFQWNVDEKNTMILTGNSSFDYEACLIPITRVKEPIVKAKPKMKALQLVIVEDLSKVTTDIESFTVDWEESLAVAPITIEDEPEEVEIEIFVHAEKMPEFPGGTRALLQYLAKETKYPELAKMNGIKGKVFVQFVINKKGAIENARILRPVDELLEKEALRVVNGMPKWQPGEQRGKTVCVAYTVPIDFRLQ